MHVAHHNNELTELTLTYALGAAAPAQAAHFTLELELCTALELDNSYLKICLSLNFSFNLIWDWWDLTAPYGTSRETTVNKNTYGETAQKINKSGKYVCS